MSASSYDPALLWAVIVAIAGGTYALRVSFIHLFGRVEAVPPRASRALALVPPAVLAALVVPRLLVADGGLALDPSNLQLVAGAAAGVVAWRTESMLATVGAGMAALWLLRFAVG